MGGMDPSAGAGLLRDVMTLAELGVHPMAIPVAETIQNGAACSFIEAPSTSALLRLEALRPHLGGNWGVKLGLCDLDFGDFRSLLGAITDLKPQLRIWDPIQAPTSGVSLHESSKLRRMAETLLRHEGWVIAPNRMEAFAIAGFQAREAVDVDPQQLAAPMLSMGARAVWLKGGHGAGDQIEDFWVTREACTSLGAFPRLEGDRRGTGCTLASAWLGFRLRGEEESEAARSAAAWLRSRWDQAFTPGGFGRPTFHPVQP
jgi:hydroxymethylpyrimidine/phosphomethylpyrimidine kinase